MLPSWRAHVVATSLACRTASARRAARSAAAADVDLELGAARGVIDRHVGHADRLLQERRLRAARDDTRFLRRRRRRRSRAARSRDRASRTRPACGDAVLLLPAQHVRADEVRLSSSRRSSRDPPRARSSSRPCRCRRGASPPRAAACRARRGRPARRPPAAPLAGSRPRRARPIAGGTNTSKPSSPV